MTVAAASNVPNPAPPPVTDPAHDLLRSERKHPLDVFFAPQNVAVIGATETPGSAPSPAARSLSRFPKRLFWY